MSAPVAEQVRSTLEARLRELEPAAAEFEQLRRVLAAFDDPPRFGAAVRTTAATHAPDTAGDGGSASVTTLPVTVRRGSKRGRDGRAPQGANKQRILAVIAEHPGIAPSQVAALTGLRRPLVASTISRLKRAGELQDHGDGVSLPAGRAPLAALPASP
ncbi:MAG: winged helix-turn-helix domain-containing protein [Solirubrobacterales bacterium]|nr:winged helix-turn-helix domain-containing protein [Solirubrobacterales bacterium]